MVAKLRHPMCISGISVRISRESLAEYEGKKVRIAGQLIGYNSLPYEDRAVLPRRMLADQVISNFCFGQRVMLIDTIDVVDGDA